LANTIKNVATKAGIKMGITTENMVLSSEAPRILAASTALRLTYATYGARRTWAMGNV
jgi:hypothetical protein